MCSNYVPTQSDIWRGIALHPSRPGTVVEERAVIRKNGVEERAVIKKEAYPGYEAPFVRMIRGELEGGLGRFGLVPWWTKPEAVKTSSRYTYNARSETVAQKPSYRDPWKRGQLCVIPAEAIYEPRYDTGKPVRWRIERADREPMAIAGIWERWKPREATPDNPDCTELESFSMLTLNADDHELMRHFHAPNDEKRMVVILEDADIEPWLDAGPQEALSFIRQLPAELLTAQPSPKPRG